LRVAKMYAVDWSDAEGGGVGIGLAPAVPEQRPRGAPRESVSGAKIYLQERIL